MIDMKQTDLILAESLMELMEHKTLKEISAQEIADNCGLSRRTFYNKFRDKYDVVEWVYKHHIALPKTQFGNDLSWYRATIELLKNIKQNAGFYQKVCRQDWFTDAFFKITQRTYRDAIEDKIGPLTREDDRGRRLLFLIDFYCYAYVHKLADWVNYNFQETVEELLDFYLAAVPQEIRETLQIPETSDV